MGPVASSPNEDLIIFRGGEILSGFAIQTGFYLSIGSPEGTLSGMPNLSF